MKRALSYVILLAAAGTRCALASGSAAAEASGAGVLFFLGGPGGAPAHGAQGYLGVDLRDVTADQAGALKLKEARGAEIILVDHDAPAGKAGLREHDVVLLMNGQSISGEEQIRRMLRESAPGKTIVLIISRDGQQMSVTTQMSNREEVERQAWEQHRTVPEPQALTGGPQDSISSGFSSGQNSSPTGPGGNSFIGSGMLMNPSYTGAMLEKMSTQLADFFGVASGAGLLVRSVEPNSPAAFAGMHAGDVVVRANARAVVSTSDWAKALRSSHRRSLAIVVLRDKKEQTLILTPDGKKRSSMDLPKDQSVSAVVATLGFSWMPRADSKSK